MEMKAGRELDTLVYERVMGRSVKNDELANGAMALFGAPPAFEMPNYSTSIAAAWLVVEKLTTEVGASLPGYEPQFELQVGERDCDSKQWRAEFYDRYGRRTWTDDLVSAVAETAPLAICLAALKAVGEK